MLSRRDRELARSLVGAYLGLFRQQLASKPKDLENKTLTAILNGVHRYTPLPERFRNRMRPPVRACLYQQGGFKIEPRSQSALCQRRECEKLHS